MSVIQTERLSVESSPKTVRLDVITRLQIGSAIVDTFSIWLSEDRARGLMQSLKKALRRDKAELQDRS
jgi:hypothetical protein